MRAQRGFTTIEATLGIVLLSILAAVSYPVWRGIFDETSAVPAKGTLANFEVQLTKLSFQLPDGYDAMLHSHVDALGVPGIDVYHDGSTPPMSPKEVSIHAVDDTTAVVTTVSEGGTCLVLRFGGDDDAAYANAGEVSGSACRAANPNIGIAYGNGEFGIFNDPGTITLTP